MKHTALRKNCSGGVVLDVVLGVAVVILGAFALSALGYGFQEIANGATWFFGI
jgi:hypothetical protein